MCSTSRSWLESSRKPHGLKRRSHEDLSAGKAASECPLHEAKLHAEGGKEQAVTSYTVFLPWSYFDNYKVMKKSTHILLYEN